MKNILFINLGNETDIIKSTTALSALTKKNPKIKIHYLLREEYLNKADLLIDIHKVHSINIKNIEKILKNDLYSDSFAFNQLDQNIENLLVETYDCVINYDGSDLSNNITSASKKNKLIGSEANGSSSKTALTPLEKYISYSKVTPVLNQEHVVSHLLAVENDNSKKIRTEQNLDTITTRNFNIIRNNHGSNINFIGVYLNSNRDRFLDENLLLEINNYIASQNNYKLILIQDPDDKKARATITQLNSKATHDLISINADHLAIASIMSEIDIIITEDINVSLIASKQGKNSIMMTSVITNLADATANTYYLKTNSKINFEDIECALSYFFKIKTLNIPSINTEHYVSARDEYSFYKHHISGPAKETYYKFLIERDIAYLLCFGRPLNKANNSIPKNHFKTFLKNYKENLILDLKVLLGTLRSFKSVALSNKNSIKLFIENLDNLLNINGKNSLSGIAISLFESRLDDVNAISGSKNDYIEALLYQLKNELQLINAYLDSNLSLVDKRSSTLSL